VTGPGTGPNAGHGAGGDTGPSAGGDAAPGAPNPQEAGAGGGGGETSPPDVSLAELDEITRYFPRIWAEAAHFFTETLYEDIALDDRTIQLILCSLLAMRGWTTGLRVHAAQALSVGATADEVRAAVLLSWAVNGLSSAAQGLHLIEDIVQTAGKGPQDGS